MRSVCKFNLDASITVIFHWFIQQKCVECLIYARHSSGHMRHTSQKRDKQPSHQESDIIAGGGRWWTISNIVSNYMFESAIKIYKHSNRDWECAILNVGRLYWEKWHLNEELKKVRWLSVWIPRGRIFQREEMSVQNPLVVGSTG